MRYMRTENETGIQIDLLIDRSDKVINFCEMKFCERNFTVDKSFYTHSRERLFKFIDVSKTKKSLSYTYYKSSYKSESI